MANISYVATGAGPTGYPMDGRMEVSNSLCSCDDDKPFRLYNLSSISFIERICNWFTKISFPFAKIKIGSELSVALFDSHLTNHGECGSRAACWALKT